MSNHHNGTVLDRAKIAQMVLSSLQDVMIMAGDNDSASVENLGEETRLIGREAVLDSMGLVNLIVDLEQGLEEEYDVALVLANERAMSQQHSPFRSVQTLTDYICQVLAEQD